MIQKILEPNGLRISNKTLKRQSLGLSEAVNPLAKQHNSTQTEKNLTYFL